MNRRQKKKQLKKYMGYNPQKKQNIELPINQEEFNRNIAEINKALDYIAKNVMPEIMDWTQNIIKGGVDLIREVNEAIMKMTPEQWQELKRELDKEQINIVERIRKSGGI